ELAAAEALVAAARASLEAARREVGRLAADREATVRQRENLRLVAPGPGLVIARSAEPGSTVVAGSPVVEVVDPEQLWIHVRFDQVSAGGLAAGLPARIVLRSRPDSPLAGRVLRVEPRADAITEEILAKILFDELPLPLPPLGELAEVTVGLPPHSAALAVPGASLHRFDGRPGVWLVEDGDLRFAPVEVGASDLDGWIEIRAGLDAGDRAVVYSERALAARSRVEVVDELPERRR
ncbi:MAG: efflux RND transporter periplasmic adaptor subunit, partial [Chloroflexi bacterium]|nr:efflux RND transporter periplasmic adaptor subunit [Chloroflexota bacterium]